MSRYSYDDSLMRGRPKGWRSLFRNGLMVGTIVLISAVSGGAVALALLGPGAAVADRPVLATPQAQPASARDVHAVTPAQAQPAASTPTNTAAAVENPPATAATAIVATARPALQSAPAQNAAPTVSAAAAEEPTTVQVPEHELTFTKGYARRRAVQTAVTTGAGTKTEVARLGEQTQIGRGTRAKSRTTVAHQNTDQRHVADARDQQALALGDPRASRRPPQQQGGLSSNSSFGSFFRGLF